MFDQAGEQTLYEFEFIDPVKDFDDVGYHSSTSGEHPALFPQPSIVGSPHTPASPFSPGSLFSPCSSSPYSFLCAPPTAFAPSPVRPRPGRILCAADFRPLNILGRGGQGTVYLVEDVMTGHRLAMKVIVKNGLRLREYPAVFEEQAVGRGLAEDGEERVHPLCVPLVGSFEDSDNFYFLTEYYPRGNLMHEVKRQGALSIKQARLWCAELLVALEYLHKRRIVHRDIKLDNILLDQDGHIALSDFGIARRFGSVLRPWEHIPPWCPRPGNDDIADGGDGQGKDVDETHSLVGTPGYTAPEVYSGSYSYPADVWGAGVVLYSMLMGKLPFGLHPKEQRLEELIARTDNLSADFDLDGFVDEDTRDLIVKMLEKDPERRSSIKELKKHRWFRGIKWNAIGRRQTRRNVNGLVEGQQQEEDPYIPYGRPFGALDELPHEWFEWMSPDLHTDDDSWDTGNEWTLESTCYLGYVGQGDLRTGARTSVAWKRPKVVQKMQGWLRRKMSVS